MASDAAIPDKWGWNQLFAFSGMEGPTRCWRDLIGTSIEDRVGYVFRTNEEIWTDSGLHVYLEYVDGSRQLRVREGFDEVRCAYVLGDAMKTHVRAAGRSCCIEVLMLDDQTAGFCLQADDGSLRGWRLVADVVLAGGLTQMEGCSAIAAWRHEQFRITPEQGSCHIEPGCVVVLPDPSTGRMRALIRWERRYTFPPEDFLAAYFRRDWAGIAEARLDWVRNLPLPPNLPAAYEKFYRRACVSLRTNAMQPDGYITTCWTTPDRWPHRNCFLWDSAFQAIGYKRIDPEWGRHAIRGMLCCQHEDGFIDSMNSPDNRRDHIETNSAVLSWMAWEVSDEGQDLAFLEECYPYFRRYADLMLRRRDERFGGLIVWPRYSHGMDNSQRFDAGMPDVLLDANLYPCYDLMILERMATRLGQNEDADRWRRGRCELADAINRHLWDDRVGFYFDEKAGKLSTVKTPVAFVALLAGVARRERQWRLLDHLFNEREFWRPLPVPSTSADDPKYEKNMWRGPCWFNLNLVVIRALQAVGFPDRAHHIARRTIEEAVRWYEADGGIYEFYDAECECSPRHLPRKGGVGALNDYGFGISVPLALCWELFG